MDSFMIEDIINFNTIYTLLLQIHLNTMYIYMKLSSFILKLLEPHGLQFRFVIFYTLDTLSVKLLFKL